MGSSGHRVPGLHLPCMGGGRRPVSTPTLPLRFPPPTHVQCSYTHNPHNNDAYLPYNKPGGIMHFLQEVGEAG